MTRYDRDHGPLGPPPVTFRFPRGGRFRRFSGWWRLGVAIAALIILYILADIGKGIYADLLWFDSVGYGSVYTKRLETRVWLFFAGAGRSGFRGEPGVPRDRHATAIDVDTPDRSCGNHRYRHDHCRYLRVECVVPLG